MIKAAAAWFVAFLSVTSVSAAQVTTAQYGNGRTGADTIEHILTSRNVNAAEFGRTGIIHVDGDVYAQVLELPRVNVPGKGTHDVIFIATEHNSVYAFDAGNPTKPLWHVTLSNPSEKGSPLSAREVMCPFIKPEVGITSTPVIDAKSNTIYVLVRTVETGRYVQRLYSLNVATGAERKGSPVEIVATVRGRGAGSDGGFVSFDPLRENPRAALLLIRGKVILSWASSCDVGPYHGWIIAYDAHSLAQVGVFNTTPDGNDGGVWQGDAGLAADTDGRIYAATGNGTFDAESGGHDFGDTILELTLGTGGFVVTDYFTPSNQKALNDRDGDLGSGGPMIFDQGAHRHLLFMGGKGGSAYLVDRDRMGKFNAAGNAAILQTVQAPGMVMGASAFWNNHVFALWSSDVIKDFAVRGGRLTDDPVARGADVFSDPGATPTISANGSKDGIVWVVQTKTWNGSDRPAVLRAYDAANVSRELFNSAQRSDRDGAGPALRFAIPTVVNGRVYVGAKREVDIYGLLPRS